MSRIPTSSEVIPSIISSMSSCNTWAGKVGPASRPGRSLRLNVEEDCDDADAVELETVTVANLRRFDTGVMLRSFLRRSRSASILSRLASTPRASKDEYPISSRSRRRRSVFRRTIATIAPREGPASVASCSSSSWSEVVSSSVPVPSWSCSSPRSSSSSMWSSAVTTVGRRAQSWRSPICQLQQTSHAQHAVAMRTPTRRFLFSKSLPQKAPALFGSYPQMLAHKPQCARRARAMHCCQLDLVHNVLVGCTRTLGDSEC